MSARNCQTIDVNCRVSMCDNDFLIIIHRVDELIACFSVAPQHKFIEFVTDQGNHHCQSPKILALED